MFERHRDRQQRQQQQQQYQQGAETRSQQSELGAQRRYLSTVYSLVREGFLSQEIEALIAVKQSYLRGELNERPDDPCRLCFARWLYEQGRIDG